MGDSCSTKEYPLTLRNSTKEMQTFAVNASAAEYFLTFIMFMT